jgi:hypothetical protein
MRILDEKTNKCFDCADKNRPAHLFTPTCPKLYGIMFTKTEFLDNETFIEARLDRETIKLNVPIENPI